MSSATTSTVNDYFFGWDLLYKTIETVVNKKSDILIALAHFVLIKHSNFRCIGIGEDKTLSEDETGSELMPDGWNNDDNKYALRYMHNRKLYLMLGHITEGTLIINLLNVETKQVSNIGLDPDETVKATKGRLNDLIPNTAHITDRYRRELVEPVFAGTTREVSTITTSTATSTTSPLESRSDPLRIGEPRRPRGEYLHGGLEPRPFGFPDIGRGDLDPLGRGGPGNLFPFPTRPDLPGGAQPRFDPFGPPERGVRPNPNPDHLQPPNFGGHDYYM